MQRPKARTPRTRVTRVRKRGSPSRSQCAPNQNGARPPPPLPGGGLIIGGRALYLEGCSNSGFIAVTDLLDVRAHIGSDAAACTLCTGSAPAEKPSQWIPGTAEGPLGRGANTRTSGRRRTRGRGKGRADLGGAGAAAVAGGALGARHVAPPRGVEPQIPGPRVTGPSAGGGGMDTGSGSGLVSRSDPHGQHKGIDSVKYVPRQKQERL